MELKISTILVICLMCHNSSQKERKEEENTSNDINAFAEVASSFLNQQSGESIGGIISDFVQSEGGKQIGDMLMSSMSSNRNANDILEGLGSIISQAGDSNTESAGFDPALLTGILSTLSMASNSKKDSSPDLGGILSLLGGFAGQNGGGMENFLGVLPTLLSAFTSGEDEQNKSDHSGHAWLLPPFIERLHVIFDNFLNSELGKVIMRSIGNDNFLKVFSDEKGKLSVRKFLEMLENHSFRKQWIQVVTSKIASIASFFADSKMQKRLLTTVQYFLNTFLKAQGFPRAAMFDPARPTETISALINHFFKKYLSMNPNAKQYVKPVVEYVQDIMKLAQDKGFFMGRGIDSSELSHQLADTINLEMIEPVARVYRAYRFAKRNPQCDKYVMCLINQQQPDENVRLPGLKKLLSKSSSLFGSWFLGNHTKTSFWILYHAIMEETNCQSLFVDSCNDFHVEEIKVTTEYVHNEL